MKMTYSLCGSSVGAYSLDNFVDELAWLEQGKIEYADDDTREEQEERILAHLRPLYMPSGMYTISYSRYEKTTTTELKFPITLDKIMKVVNKNYPDTGACQFYEFATVDTDAMTIEISVGT